MPWCETCKMEYREGITVCADCGKELVEELNDEVPYSIIGIAEEENDAKKLFDFLQFSNITSTKLEYIEEKEVWSVLVSKEDEKEAKKLFQAFYTVEQENKSKKPDENVETFEPNETDETTDISVLEEQEEDLLKKTIGLRTASSSTYVKKQEQYNDLKFTAYIFIGFGIVGLVFVILNITNMLNILGNPLSLIIMAGMVIGFLLVGISSLRKSGVVKTQIGEENTMTDEINHFMEDAITQELLMEYHDESLSDEINYFNKTEQIKELIKNRFGDLDESYIDQLVEDFYTQLEQN